MPTRIVVRDDPRLTDEAYLLVRANTDHNTVMSVRNAVLHAHEYAHVPEHFGRGAIMISTYLAPTEEAAATLIATTRWDWFGTATLGTIRDHGFEVWATSSERLDDAAGIWVPADPLQSDHADVLVGRYPQGQPPYGDLSKAEKAALRGLYQDRFDLALSLFDPRRLVTPTAGPTP